MAKFRRSHTQVGKGGATVALRMLVVVMLVGILLVAIRLFQTMEWPTPPEEQAYYLPVGETSQIIDYQHYTAGIDSSWKQAAWVAYILRDEQLEGRRVKRKDDYLEDERIRFAISSFRDYSHNPYDRGHLVPVADRQFSKSAMRETFFLSNISPQLDAFNRGVWRELEETTRQWAMAREELFVVSGPILVRPAIDRIGQGRGLPVPSAYFKVLLDLTEPEYAGIAFVLPNEGSERPLSDYAMPIDSAEVLTGFDFFANLLEPSLEDSLEAELDLSAWPFDPDKYRQRVSQWNKVR